MKRIRLQDRSLPAYTRGEEIFNMVSHIVGGAFSLVVLVTCVWKAASHGNTTGVITGAIFGVTMLLLYTMSSIYHGLLKPGTAKKVMQVLDHCTIFLLIAGTYTPIALLGICPASPWAGWTILAVVWISAIVGISLNGVDLRKYRVFSMTCYICSGWCVMLCADLLLRTLPMQAFWLLLFGGVAYTVGAVLYGIGSKKRYMHCVFHLFVILGSALHYACIFIYLM
ncbi:MAG: hemolysin III family protein [Eubacteriales bacterium]|nr:hemolysin III family protein [Eubacteriales bacterium]